MKIILSWIIFLGLLLTTTAFSLNNEINNYGETHICDGVKKIVDAFNKLDYKKIQGDEVEGSVHEERFKSLITIKGFKEQFIYEKRYGVYFEALLDKKFSSTDKMSNELKNIADQLEKCLSIKPLHYSSSTGDDIYYTFEINDVEMTLSGNRPADAMGSISLLVVGEAW